MARGVPGAVAYLFDLKGRRRATAALRRALPELEAGEHRRLARASYVRESLCGKCERRSQRDSDVDLCRRLRFEGWENLHNTESGPLFLLAPLGSPGLASRVLGLYHEGSESVTLVAPSAGEETAGEETLEADLFRRAVLCRAKPARLALAGSRPAVWTLALPERDGRWTVYFLPPVPPFRDDTIVTLTQRYLATLEEMIRRHPDCWPWRRPG